LLENDFEGIITIAISKVNESIIIDFIDNGIGLEEQKVPLMFDAFFTEKKVKQGTGLGLAVSSDIIRNHHGQITGRNEEGGGFRVTVILPDSINT
jgi:signal transduction histidine kinase